MTISHLNTWMTTGYGAAVGLMPRASGCWWVSMDARTTLSASQFLPHVPKKSLGRLICFVCTVLSCLPDRRSMGASESQVPRRAAYRSNLHEGIDSYAQSKRQGTLYKGADSVLWIGI